MEHVAESWLLCLQEILGWGLTRPFLILTGFLKRSLSCPLCHIPQAEEGSGQRGHREPAQPIYLPCMGCRPPSSLIFLFPSPNFYDTVNSLKAKQCLKIPQRWITKPAPPPRPCRPPLVHIYQASEPLEDLWQGGFHSQPEKKFPHLSAVTATSITLSF